MIIKIESDINILNNQYNLLIISSTDSRFQKELNAFWTSVIKPVDTLILPTNNKNLFVSKLNEFNIRINVLNAILTKRNKKITKKTATILKIIRRRWVSILKVTLRR